MKYLKYLKNYILSFFYDLGYFFFGSWRSRIGGFKYYTKSKQYPNYLKKGNAVEAIKYLALKHCNGRGVDVGSSHWPLKGARPIWDNKEENAYKILEDDKSLDFVFSSHVLEHLENWERALEEWYRALKPKGVIFLYLPHPICKMWEPEVNKSHLWQPEPQIIVDYLEKELKMNIKEVSYTPDVYMSFHVIAEK